MSKISKGGEERKFDLAVIYLFKINSRNTRERSKIYSNLTTKVINMDIFRTFF